MFSFDIMLKKIGSILGFKRRDVVTKKEYNQQQLLWIFVAFADYYVND
ncbi:hypothetical protein [Colwellia polaris]|nr:hypothetical protein [Colwellia polaris]